MTERDELRPCPFCGGEPGMMQQTKVNWAVMCHVCGAEGGWSNPSDAIALWNRRATVEPVAVRTDAFRDCIDAVKGAIAFGQQDTNLPPDGHWLVEFWEIGRKLAAPQPAVAAPVAWIHPDTLNMLADGKSGHVWASQGLTNQRVPLYAAPQPIPVGQTYQD